MRGLASLLARSRRSAAGGECGSALIETSLAYMLGMAMVLGIIELSMMCYTFGVVSEAARSGVRYAVIHGADSSTCSGPSTGCTDSTGANVTAQVTAFAATFAKNRSAMAVTVSYPDSASTVPSRVIVSVAYTYKPLFAISATNHIFNVTEQGRIVY
jgi:Flp pilus assembly protein TadG